MSSARQWQPMNSFCALKIKNERDLLGQIVRLIQCREEADHVINEPNKPDERAAYLQ